MKHFLRQLLIFLVYLTGCSIFLFNKKGNAEIYFVATLFACSLIHLIVILYKWSVSRKRKNEGNNWNGADFISLIIIIFLYTVIYAYLIGLFK